MNTVNSKVEKTSNTVRTERILKALRAFLIGAGITAAFLILAVVIYYFLNVLFVLILLIVGGMRPGRRRW